MKRQILKSMIWAGYILVAAASNAETLYDWNFKIADEGASLCEVVSTGTAAPTTFSDSQIGAGLKITNDGLQVQQEGGKVSKPANNSFAEIEELSAGKYWLVAELSGWTMTSGVVDFSFTVAERPNAAAAGLRLAKTGSKISIRQLHPNGFESIEMLPVSGNSPLILVLEMDLDRSAARICCRQGQGDWVCGSEHPNKLFGAVTHLRVSASAMQPGDTICLEHLYVTDESPIK